MYVATTTSSKKKGRALQKLGADLIIDYTNENFEDAVEYYDAVLDPMNWLYEERTFEKKKDKAPVLKHRVGHYLNLLGSDWKMGEDGNENTNGFYTMKNYLYHKFIHFVLPGTTIPRYDLIYVSPDGEQLQRILDLVAEGIMKPVIDRTFALKDAARAYEHLEQGHATGKVILKI